MSRTSGESNVRIEHKLDAILYYLKRLTGDEPIPLSKPIPGLNGLTNGICPITQTQIHLKLDPKLGVVVREDGLSTGLIECKIPARPDTSFGVRGIMLQNNFGESDDSSER